MFTVHIKTPRTSSRASTSSRRTWSRETTCARFVTEEVRQIVRQEAASKQHIVDVRNDLRDMRSELREIRDRLEKLEASASDHSGYAKEIDHALERIAAIEKLGHQQKNRRLAFPTSCPAAHAPAAGSVMMSVTCAPHFGARLSCIQYSQRSASHSQSFWAHSPISPHVSRPLSHKPFRPLRASHHRHRNSPPQPLQQRPRRHHLLSQPQPPQLPLLPQLHHQSNSTQHKQLPLSKNKYHNPILARSRP